MQFSWCKQIRWDYSKELCTRKDRVKVLRSGTRQSTPKISAGHLAALGALYYKSRIQVVKLCKGYLCTSCSNIIKYRLEKIRFAGASKERKETLFVQRFGGTYNIKKKEVLFAEVPVKLS